MNCPLCKSSNIRLQASQYQGYVENTYYDIFLCDNCQTSFIDPDKVDPNIYDQIYAESGEGGYTRYYDYAIKVKNEPNPLAFLAKEETTYLPLLDYLKKQTTKLDILEVGCGYGYTAFAVAKLGHNVTAIDISSEAINFAKKMFNNEQNPSSKCLYQAADVTDLTNEHKFDLIYANEVIEHLPDPQGFMLNVKRLLKPNGTIHLTTPNKDYAIKVKPEAIWVTILPPHHMLWGSSKGLADLAVVHDLQLEKYDFKNSFGRGENRLNEARRINNENIPKPFIVDKKPVEFELSASKKLAQKLLGLYLVQFLSTIFLTQILGFREYKTNAIFLKNQVPN